jgi:hypothetical protein
LLAFIRVMCSSPPAPLRDCCHSAAHGVVLCDTCLDRYRPALLIVVLVSCITACSGMPTIPCLGPWPEDGPFRLDIQVSAGALGSPHAAPVRAALMLLCSKQGTCPCALGLKATHWQAARLHIVADGTAQVSHSQLQHTECMHGLQAMQHDLSLCMPAAVCLHGLHGLRCVRSCQVKLDARCSALRRSVLQAWLALTWWCTAEHRQRSMVVMHQRW